MVTYVSAGPEVSDENEWLRGQREGVGAWPEFSHVTAAYNLSEFQLFDRLPSSDNRHPNPSVSKF